MLASCKFAILTFLFIFSLCLSFSYFAADIWHQNHSEKLLANQRCSCLSWYRWSFEYPDKHVILWWNIKGLSIKVYQLHKATFFNWLIRKLSVSLFSFQIGYEVQILCTRLCPLEAQLIRATEVCSSFCILNLFFSI